VGEKEGWGLEAAALEFAVEDAVYYAPQVHIAVQLVAVLLSHVAQIRASI
jgi:hypothetical protein